MFVVIYILAMIATLVGVDLAFFRHHIVERLLANIAVVLVFAVFYLQFLKRRL